MDKETWESFLEAFYRALMILAHWIEDQRKKSDEDQDPESD